MRQTTPLTEKILDVTKIESQLLKSDKEHFDLNDIISNAVLDLENQRVRR